jgi:molybdopterin converting factor small subunit
VRSFVNLFLDDRNIRTLGGLDTPVHNGATLHIVPAVAGGQDR